MARRSLLAALFALLLSPAAASPQWPGELAGRVTDAETGAPAAVALETVTATGRRTEALAGVRLERAAIEASGARTVGDALKRVPGVVVRGQGAESRQTASIRGSGADAVLVLLDGVPPNDPVTGEASS